MIVLIFILFLLLLMFIPVPIKIFFYYNTENNTPYLYIYKFRIKSKKSKKKKSKNKTKNKKLIFTTFLNLIKSLNNNKYKPTIKFKFYMNFGLEDASNTAISYGLIYTFSPFIHKLLDYIFKSNECSININPIFNKKIVDLKVESIIIISFAKLIIILLLISKNLLAIRKLKYSNLGSI